MNQLPEMKNAWEQVAAIRLGGMPVIA